MMAPSWGSHDRRQAFRAHPGGPGEGPRGPPVRSVEGCGGSSGSAPARLEVEAVGAAEVEAEEVGVAEVIGAA